MPDQLIDPFVSVNQLAREKTILDVLRLTLYEKDERGRRYSISAACKAVGIDPSTWGRWVQEGFINGPLQKFAGEIHQMVYDEIMPEYQKIIHNLVRMALGQPPEDAPTMRVSAADMRAAIQDVLRIVPARPLDKLSSGTLSELEHMESYQPGQVFINIQAGDFIYSGQSHFSLSPPDSEDEIIEG
jgi:hypothetical protein